MKKVPLYSRSRRIVEPAIVPTTNAVGAGSGDGPPVPRALARWKTALLRHERRLWALAVVAL
ncbi:MAG: hypothetical protein ABI156_14320, partial [Caldimonas sp.]